MTIIRETTFPKQSGEVGLPSSRGPGAWVLTIAYYCREALEKESSEGRQTSAHDGDLGFDHGPVDEGVQTEGLIDAPAVFPEDDDSDFSDDR